MNQTPPREWFEENLVHDGKVEYCSECKRIHWSLAWNPRESVSYDT